MPDFWQQQGDRAIFDAAWEMVQFAGEFKVTDAQPRPDFRDLLRSMNRCGVRYLIVGDYAVMKHTEPFFTTDIGIWIEPPPATPGTPTRLLLSSVRPLPTSQ